MTVNRDVVGSSPHWRSIGFIAGRVLFFCCYLPFKTLNFGYDMIIFYLRGIIMSNFASSLHLFLFHC